MAEQLTGRVDYFNTSRGKAGFGYLTATTGERFFFRMRGGPFPSAGSVLIFDVDPTPRSGQYRRAVNLRFEEVSCGA